MPNKKMAFFAYFALLILLHCHIGTAMHRLVSFGAKAASSELPPTRLEEKGLKVGLKPNQLTLWYLEKDWKKKVEEYAEELAAHKRVQKIQVPRIRHQRIRNALEIAIVYDDVLQGIYPDLECLRIYFRSLLDIHQGYVSSMKSVIKAELTTHKIPLDKVGQQFQDAAKYTASYEETKLYHDRLDLSIQLIEKDYGFIKKAEKGDMTVADMETKVAERSEELFYRKYFLEHFVKRLPDNLKKVDARVARYMEANTANSMVISIDNLPTPLEFPNLRMGVPSLLNNLDKKVRVPSLLVKNTAGVGKKVESLLLGPKKVDSLLKSKPGTSGKVNSLLMSKKVESLLSTQKNTGKVNSLLVTVTDSKGKLWIPKDYVSSERTEQGPYQYTMENDDVYEVISNIKIAYVPANGKLKILEKPPFAGQEDSTLWVPPNYSTSQKTEQGPYQYTMEDDTMYEVQSNVKIVQKLPGKPVEILSKPPKL